MHEPLKKESGAHAHAALAARVGTVLKEKWRLDKLLGVGGMAAVYAATHRNGKRVAIKMLHPEHARNADVRTRFLREGYLANAVDHEGVVSIADDDVTDDGTVFLVMELLEGETVERRWERKLRRLPVVEVLSIAHELLDVLGAAHAKGVVHRDIKPENIFLTRTGKVKVLDFGIARLRQLSAGPATTQNGAAMGTPAFMSPEQARGRWDEVDSRSDVWAVGATMFALLTGRFVHQAETLNEQLLAAMTTVAPSITTVLPDLVPEVARAIDRAIAFKADDRWDDARAMQLAIRDAYAATCESPGALRRAPRASVADPDETESMAIPDFDFQDTSGADELLERAERAEMTEHGVTNAPSAAPEAHVLPRRRSPVVVGLGAGALGIMIALAGFVHRAPKGPAMMAAPAAAMQPIQAVAEVRDVPTVDVSTLPRAEDDPTPSPPATGVPATLPVPAESAPVAPHAAVPVTTTTTPPAPEPSASASELVTAARADVSQAEPARPRDEDEKPSRALDRR
jgi:eukaryotic-like serine/threonine-protein kinase